MPKYEQADEARHAAHDQVADGADHLIGLVRIADRLADSCDRNGEDKLAKDLDDEAKERVDAASVPPAGGS